MKKYMYSADRFLVSILTLGGIVATVIIILALLLYGIGVGVYYASEPDTQTLAIMQVRSLWFIFGLIIFPRITLAVSSLWFGLITGGFGWWLAWLIAPRFLIAGIASANYWDTNPFLVICAWILAFDGGSSSSEN